MHNKSENHDYSSDIIGTNKLYNRCIPNHDLLIIPIHWLASSICLLSTNKLVCGGGSGAVWLHTGGGWGDTPFYVKCFECLEKRYINGTYYYVLLSCLMYCILINWMHPCWIKVFLKVFIYLQKKSIYPKLFNGTRGYNSCHWGGTFSESTSVPYINGKQGTKVI